MVAGAARGGEKESLLDGFCEMSGDDALIADVTAKLEALNARYAQGPRSPSLLLRL